MTTDKDSFVEVIIPGVLNTYDVIVRAEKENHSILTQRKDLSGAMRMLIKPYSLRAALFSRHSCADDRQIL